MATRVSLHSSLPVDMDMALRQSLAQTIADHARQINWATGDDVSRVTASQSLTADIALVDASAGAVSLTLPPAADWFDRTMRIKKTDSSTNSVNIVPQSGETCDGTATVSIIMQYTCVQVVSDGIAWYLV